MLGRFLRVGLGIAVLCGTGATQLLAQADTFEWSGEIASGQTLEVEGISGNIHAVLASGTRTEVVATKRGRSSDFDYVKIEVVEESDGVVICAVYGERNRGCNGESERSASDHQEHRSLDVSVDYEIRLPAGVELVGSMVSGDIDTEGVRSDVTATTVSGDIRVSTTGVAWGTTVNGSMDIEMGGTGWDDLHFSTVNGDITLSLPADVDVDVEFDSLSGDFESDFDSSWKRREGRWVGSHVRGTLGDGGRSLSFNTVSGDVTLKRAG